jgi:translation initiation factor IF-3
VKAIKPDARTNDEIRAREVLLISETGEQIGVVAIEDALRRAREAELDLVEVAPDDKRPVCRIYDYKKVLYEQKRRKRESQKKSRAGGGDLKECKMRVTIDPHDRSTKLRKVRELLEHGDKVKFTLQFRGREVTKPQLGQALVDAILKELADIAEVEKPAQRADRFIHMIVMRRKDWAPGKVPKKSEPAGA